MKTFYVSSYRKPRLNDDEVIEACFRDAQNEPEREIIFDEKEYHISTSVLIPGNTAVILDGCLIKQNDGTFDTAFRGDNIVPDEKDPGTIPQNVHPINNIKLIGRNGARISGPDRNDHDNNPGMKQIQEKTGDFWGWRTLTVSFSKCRGLEIGGISFVQTRCWCISLDMCENGYLHDIRIDSNIKNGDGIDLRSGCHHFLIENISGITSDDNIACTALFENGAEYVYPNKTSVYPMEPTRESGQRSAYDRDISDVTIRNCKVGGMHHGIICLAANGCKVYDIRIENIEECETGSWRDPYNEATIKIYTGYGSGYNAGDLHDITVQNVVSRFSKHPVLCNAEVRNVKLCRIISECGNEMRLDYPDGIEIVD